MTQSLGEYRVGIDFNPSQHPAVMRIKADTAALIDLCQEIWSEAVSDRSPDASEKARCAATAMMYFETAAMWAVKAATKKPRT